MVTSQLPRNGRLAEITVRRVCGRTAIVCSAAALLLATGAVRGQVITVNTETGTVTNNSTGEVISAIDRQYAQVQPTHVALSDTRLDNRGRILLIRQLVAEQGFAMRPLPLGHAGLTLEANGGITPAGQAYVDMVGNEGISSKPGGRVVITDVKVDENKIIFTLNGGPDLKHRFLRHIEIGDASGPDGQGAPIVQDSGANGQEGTGSRLTLRFKGPVPEVDGAQVKELLAPLISFGVESPTEAFANTLPAPLKKAVLEHRVLVGMTTDMVLNTLGRPEQKVRETEGQMPWEEWIYGHPPDTVTFVRINGNRVIRVEVAKPGEEMAVYTQDEVTPQMEVSGMQPDADHVARLGDVVRDPAKEAPAPPPTLRNPGEPLAEGTPASRREYEEKPVRFPKQNPEDLPGYNPDSAPTANGQPGTQAGAQAGNAAAKN